MLTEKVAGATTRRAETNGYVFWGLTAALIGIPDVLAALSSSLRADIPWSTVSALVGRDIEARHHWAAPVVVGLVVWVAVHALGYPAAKKAMGRALRRPAREAVELEWARAYIPFVALAAAAAGAIATGVGAGKDGVGYAIFVTLALLGIVVPSALAYFCGRVLDLPTLFATLALLRERVHVAAELAVALLAVLLVHLALYPWPNYHFGTP